MACYVVGTRVVGTRVVGTRVVGTRVPRARKLFSACILCSKISS